MNDPLNQCRQGIEYPSIYLLDFFLSTSAADPKEMFSGQVPAHMSTHILID